MHQSRGGDAVVGRPSTGLVDLQGARLVAAGLDDLGVDKIGRQLVERTDVLRHGIADHRLGRLLVLVLQGGVGIGGAELGPPFCRKGVHRLETGLEVFLRVGEMAAFGFGIARPQTRRRIGNQLPGRQIAGGVGKAPG